MEKGDNVLINYIHQDKSTIAIFHGKRDGIYYLEDIHGIFAVSEKAVSMGEIVMDAIED